MRAIVMLMALVPFLPPAAAADTGRLAEMLRMIPDAAVPPDAPLLGIAYGNGDAVRGVARNGNPAWPADDWAHEHAAMRAAPPAQAQALAAGGGEALALGYRDWVHALEVSAPPVRMGVHELFPDSEMRLRGALFGRGLEVSARDGRTLFWEGDADHEAQPGRSDPTMPFGGAEGLALRVSVEGDRALWATGWPQIEAMQGGGGPTLADRPEVAQALAGLEAAVRRYGRLVSLRLRLDPAGAGLGGWPDPAPTGVFFADVVDRRAEVALVGLTFRPGTDARAIAERIGQRWGGSMLARWSREPAILDLPGPRPGFVLAVEGGWGEDEAASNEALAALVRARDNGTLAALIAP
ncbi:hypothetical protein P6F26_04405 [Roseibacterium sp. SDUM158017]|uniref:hypothetical protein n=1 Tax=Roseicyclus salinarum TaxID=3036773 RepID=UPI002414D04A|nr:hypothetical protein [Roseibacterium sp. SDUM158017]MDG4647675.1 hypothetical protein [Roseibacterium sp. SDUM158017]